MHVHESKKPCYGGSVFEVDELLIFLHNYPYCLLLLFVIRKEQHLDWFGGLNENYNQNVTLCD